MSTSVSENLTRRVVGRNVWLRPEQASRQEAYQIQVQKLRYTAPGKRESYGRVLATDISTNPVQRAGQLDENPGLWLRLHGNIRSLILPDVLETGEREYRKL